MVTSATITELLPAELEQKFVNGGSLATTAIKVAERYSEWFASSGIPFFRNYTDHSFTHCIEVFRTALELIPTESLAVIGASDASILLMACGAHDAGMHLTESQFLTLISITDRPLSKLDKLPWSETWDAFSREAKRFNDKLLTNIFGDTKPASDIPSSELDFTNRDRLLVGEFLRRNHPRLAHELCLGLGDLLGLHGLMADLTLEQKEIIGLVARSHGMPLRQMVDHVADNYDLRDFQGIHIVYLMSLLRVADYAQIQASRAPLIHLKLHRVTSPISAREWRVHQSIRNINQTHDDPESFYVDSRPTNIQDFVRTKDWLSDLQTELDTAWAVLGEVYGRYSTSSLNELKLKVRRIRSNVLDGTGEFEFVPEALKFKVAEAEMLTLLLGPLYGDHPMYGLRELLQNSRDATLERDLIQPFASRPQIDVRIDQSVNPPTVEISDNGIGMSLSVIRDYFLNAGASYRSSDQWRSKHIDSDGHSKISRSGRFGVGALAAFLIGKRIEVTTKSTHQALDHGYIFSCKLQDEIVEVRPIECDVGTTIRIFSSIEKVNELLLSINLMGLVFQFKDVSVNLEILDGDGKITDLTPISDDREIWDTLTFSTENFSSVVVEFYPKSYIYRSNDDRCYVNGIGIGSFIKDEFRFGESIYLERDINTPINLPGIAYGDSTDVRFNMSVSVEDKDAKVLLNLARTDVTSVDQGVNAAVSAHVFSKYRQELSNFSDDCLSGDEWRRNSGWFSISATTVMFVAGEMLPNDRIIFEKMNLRFVVRASETPCKQMENSKVIRDAAIFATTSEMSSNDAMSFFRDLRYQADYTETSSAIFVAPSVWLRDFITQRGTSNWIKKQIKDASELEHNGLEKLILRFGNEDEDLENRLIDYLKISNANFIELYTDRDGLYFWNRFRSHRMVGKATIASELW